MKSSKQSSPKMVTANQLNAKKSSGPLDTRSTRYNAVKHGLVSEGVTELDKPEAFAERRAQLVEHFKPEGPIEAYFMRRMALCMVRVERAVRLEAECITEALNPPTEETTYPHGGDMTEDLERLNGRTTVLDCGLPASLPITHIEELQKFQRYETSNENKLARALAQLEAVQRARRIGASKV